MFKQSVKVFDDIFICSVTAAAAIFVLDSGYSWQRYDQLYYVGSNMVLIIILFLTTLAAGSVLFTAATRVTQSDSLARTIAALAIILGTYVCLPGTSYGKYDYMALSPKIFIFLAATVILKQAVTYMWSRSKQKKTSNPF